MDKMDFAQCLEAMTIDPSVASDEAKDAARRAFATLAVNIAQSLASIAVDLAAIRKAADLHAQWREQFWDVPHGQ